MSYYCQNFTNNQTYHVNLFNFYVFQSKDEKNTATASYFYFSKKFEIT